MNCTECHDIVKLHPEWRRCGCGRAAARYLKDDNSAQIFGTARVLGISNDEYKKSLKSSQGNHYKWWIIPEDRLKIQRIRQV